MTREELIEHGYREQLCKIGNLYFKGDFFCYLRENGKVDYRANYNDMVSLGKASTFEEINQLEKLYYNEQLTKAKMKVALLEKIIESYDN